MVLRKTVCCVFCFQQEEKEIALLSTFSSRWAGLVFLGKGEEAKFGE